MKRYAVYLSPLATLKLDLLFDHLEGEWGSKAKHSFRDKLNKQYNGYLSIQKVPPNRER